MNTKTVELTFVKSTKGTHVYGSDLADAGSAIGIHQACRAATRSAEIDYADVVVGIVLQQVVTRRSKRAVKVLLS